MTFESLTSELKRYGLTVQASSNNLTVSPARLLTGELRAAIRDYKPILTAQVRPDDTLPDEIYIPATCSRDLESIAASIDAQRWKAVA